MIVSVAVRYEGIIFSMERPARHHNVLHKMTDLGVTKLAHEHQGFLNHRGEFLNREDALWEALADGQVLDQENLRHPNLYSEDLW
jgi:hypothetical protein